MIIKNIKSITVYCSSSNKISKKYKKQAKNIGIFISKKKIKLIYGGGKNGLMGEVARGVKENKGYVIGIIPEFLKTKENMNTKIDQIIITKDMHKRKNLLYKKGDAILALPGGPGTIEEITEIISWLNLNIHSKPIILFNYKNFWDPLIKMYNKVYDNKFNSKKSKSLFYCVNNISEFKKMFD